MLDIWWSSFFESVFFIQWVLLLTVFSFVPLSASLIYENWWGSFTVPLADIRRALSSPCLLQLHPLLGSSNRIKMGFQVYQESSTPAVNGRISWGMCHCCVSSSHNVWGKLLVSWCGAAEGRHCLRSSQGKIPGLW